MLEMAINIDHAILEVFESCQEGNGDNLETQKKFQQRKSIVTN